MILIFYNRFRTRWVLVFFHLPNIFICSFAIKKNKMSWEPKKIKPKQEPIDGKMYLIMSHIAAHNENQKLIKNVSSIDCMKYGQNGSVRFCLQICDLIRSIRVSASICIALKCRCIKRVSCSYDVRVSLIALKPNITTKISLKMGQSVF